MYHARDTGVGGGDELHALGAHFGVAGAECFYHLGTRIDKALPVGVNGRGYPDATPNHLIDYLHLIVRGPLAVVPHPGAVFDGGNSGKGCVTYAFAAVAVSCNGQLFCVGGAHQFGHELEIKLRF